MAYNKIKNKCYEPYYDFNDVYEITNALSIYGINELDNKKIAIFSEHLTTDQKEKLQLLFPTCSLRYNEFLNEDIIVIMYNVFSSENFISNMIYFIKSRNGNAKIVLYYFEKSHAVDMDDLNSIVQKTNSDIHNKLQKFNYGYFLYFRHNYFLL